MERKIRKITGWLLAALLVVGMVVGCGGKPSAAPEAQRRQEAGTNRSDPGDGISEQAEENATGSRTEESQAEGSPERESQAEGSSERESQAEGSSERESQAEGSSEQESQAEGSSAEESQIEESQTQESLAEEGEYTGKDQVALYLHVYGRLPDNYITKREAQDLGWDNKAGNLDEVAPGKSIGGDRFGNYEGLLPEKPGRKYFECDLDFEGGYRGAKRLIYSNDGLIFYTEDHYKTFEQLY